MQEINVSNFSHFYDFLLNLTLKLLDHHELLFSFSRIFIIDRKIKSIQYVDYLIQNLKLYRH